MGVGGACGFVGVAAGAWDTAGAGGGNRLARKTRSYTRRGLSLNGGRPHRTCTAISISLDRARPLRDHLTARDAEEDG